VKIDYIVKEELLRSLAIYWILFLIIAIPTVGGYLPLSTASAFPLAAILTAIYFCVMVWYRRNENLHDPNPISILRHALRSGEQREEKTKQRRAIVEKVVDAFLVVMIFLIYLYASFAYSINQIFWLPVLILIGLFLARIRLHRRRRAPRQPCTIGCLLPHSSRDRPSALPGTGVSCNLPPPGNRACRHHYFSHSLHLGTATHTEGKGLMDVLCE
jgi:hypothetical protein